MRGNTLTNILAMLNAEVGNAGQPNATRDAIFAIALSNKQKTYATQFSWPFLQDRWDATVQPGTQYMVYPTVNDQGDTSAINFDWMPTVEVLWSTKYNPVEYGIGSEQYNALDVRQGQTSDPILRWRMANNVDEAGPATPNEFEVWPVPVTQQTVRFTGQRTLENLVNGNDTADLDDMLLVLSVAADDLKRRKQPDWQDKLLASRTHFTLLRQNYPSIDKQLYLGGGSANRKERKLVGMTIAVR